MLLWNFVVERIQERKHGENVTLVFLEPIM